MKNFLRKLKNKYLLVSLIAFLWMLFFDRHDLLFQYRLRRKIKQLEQDKLYYQSVIQKLNEEKIMFIKNPDALEKYAREQYWMKQENEDLYVIVNE
jgi:cell division protein FtsB